MNEKNIYKFWVGPFKYTGNIVDENVTHWTVDDTHFGIILVPKIAVRIPINKSGDNDANLL